MGQRNARYTLHSGSTPKQIGREAPNAMGKPSNILLGLRNRGRSSSRTAPPPLMISAGNRIGGKHRQPCHEDAVRLQAALKTIIEHPLQVD